MTNVYNTNAAAEFLDEQIEGKSKSYWYQRLTNSRKSDRKDAFAPPFEMMGRMVIYSEEELIKFVKLEKSRRLGKIDLSDRAVEALRAFGMGEQGGGSQGRKWAGASANSLVSVDGKSIVVQAIINEPLMVFAMSPEQAISFGQELIDAGRMAQRHNATKE